MEVDFIEVECPKCGKDTRFYQEDVPTEHDDDSVKVDCVHCGDGVFKVYRYGGSGIAINFDSK